MSQKPFGGLAPPAPYPLGRAVSFSQLGSLEKLTAVTTHQRVWGGQSQATKRLAEHFRGHVILARPPFRRRFK